MFDYITLDYKCYVGLQVLQVLQVLRWITSVALDYKCWITSVSMFDYITLDVV